MLTIEQQEAIDATRRREALREENNLLENIKRAKARGIESEIRRAKEAYEIWFRLAR